MRATALLVLLCFCMILGQPVYADTDGTELQILDPSYLEIQLGTDWAGTEFQLRTDMGVYPDTIRVNENGILHLEIGGSKTYLLSSLSDDTLTVTLPYEESPSSTLEPEEQSNANSIEETLPISFGAGILIFILGLLVGLGFAFVFNRIGSR